MKYLDYMGDIYYAPHHDFNGNSHFLKKTSLAAFLYGTAPLAALKGKKVALLGVGANSFFCSSLLLQSGVEVAAYCDNDPQLVGKLFRGKVILSPFDIFRSKEYHLIACPDNEIFEATADQFLHCGVTAHSLFFKADTVIDFKREDIRRPILDALNCLINVDYGPRIHHNAPMGITMRLIPSLEWWSQELYWLYEDLQAAPQPLRVLDIGPGFGFISLIIKLLRPDSDIHWLNLALEDSTASAYIDAASKRYPITQHFGMIEDPAYMLPEDFDCIIMTEIFEHFAVSPAVTLRKIAGMLKEGGRIYLSTPNWGKANFYGSWRDIPPFSGSREDHYKRNKSRIDWMDLNLIHTYVYREEELRELFAECGLTVERFVLNDCNNFNFVLSRQIS